MRRLARLAVAGTLAAALFVACSSGPMRPTEAPNDPFIETLEPQDGSLLPCETHCDCLQGEFCYKGTCLRDPHQPVYCCSKPGCMPGQRCVTPEGAMDRCAESPDWSCETACDCGPAHACIDVAGVGTTCVKDEDDPWLEGASIYGVAIPPGEPTYCFSDFDVCVAGLQAYARAGLEPFASFDPYTSDVRDFCGGAPCMYAGDCTSGTICVDTRDLAETTPHASCDRQGGFCIAGASAEAILGFAPSDLLRGCDTTTVVGQPCEAGWSSAGVHVVEMIVGTSSACGDGICAHWESPEACPADCRCGDGVCSGTEHLTGSCRTDCGVCGDGACTGLETAKNCPSDCTAIVGDGSCSAAEATGGVDSDCGCEASAAYRDWPGMCGDGVCQRGGDIPEHGFNCPADCPPPTLATEAEGLIDLLEAMRDDGRLNDGVARSLIRKIQQVARLAGRGKPGEAAEVLENVRQQIDDLVPAQIQAMDALALTDLTIVIERVLAEGGGG